MRFFSSTLSNKNTTKSYKKFKAWKKPSFANEHQPRSQVFIVKPNSHVQIFQLIYILVFLVVWTVSLHGNKPEKPVFIVMSNFQTWPEASGNCLLLKTYLTCVPVYNKVFHNRTHGKGELVQFISCCIHRVEWTL